MFGSPGPALVMLCHIIQEDSIPAYRKYRYPKRKQENSPHERNKKLGEENEESKQVNEENIITDEQLPEFPSRRRTTSGSSLSSSSYRPLPPIGQAYMVTTFPGMFRPYTPPL